MNASADAWFLVRPLTLTAFHALGGAAATEASTTGTRCSTSLASDWGATPASVSDCIGVLLLGVRFGDDGRRRWLEGTMAASSLLKSLYASKDPAMVCYMDLCVREDFRCVL